MVGRLAECFRIFTPRLVFPSVLICLQAVAISVGDEKEYTESTLSEADRDHWAFRSLSHPEVPTHGSGSWRKNEIDDFIAAELEAKGLEPQPEASPRVLVRRLFLDLVGLLPEASVLDEYENNSSDEGYQQLVDRLLGSEGYGQHAAQYWLDLARFAETDGFEHDQLRPDAWRYRDWVVNALNHDLPYNEFVRYQIAGDLIEPGSDEAATATQFCLSGPDMPDMNSQEERRHILLNELSSTVAEVIMGLQMGCAQCHDHKYDPISQADFYRFRANFEDSIEVRKNITITKLSSGASPKTTAHVLIRGDFRKQGPQVQAGAPRVLESDSKPFGEILSAVGRQNRLALADWLASENHPTTARVIVNRVWQQHFGVGLCETGSDFGVMGQPPINGPLLDWLAQSFVRNGWSLKKLQRMIVSSATYRQRSWGEDGPESERGHGCAKSVACDPQNRLLSRFPRQRLRGEVLRDTMLQVAGVLNEKSGGPGVRPPLSAELVETLLKDHWVVTPDRSEHFRRSIYVFARRNLRYPMFEVFDRPAANESCSRRYVSTTAPQSLHLLNSEFAYHMSNLTAERIRSRANAEAVTEIDEAFRLILRRKPTAAERVDVGAFLDESKQAGQDGFLSLCLSLFNSSEFVFLE